MESYPKMISLLNKHHSLDSNANLIEIGRHFLQGLCFEIVYERKIKICNQELIKLIPSILAAELRLKTESQLLVYLGKRVFMTYHPKERQIAKQTLLTVFKKYNFPKIPSYQDLKRSRKNKYQSDSQQSSSYAESSSQPQSQSNEKQEENWQANVTYMAEQPPVLLRVDESIKKEHIQAYLEKMTAPQTILKYFCETMRNVPPIYTNRFEWSINFVTISLEFNNFFTSYIHKRYESKGIFADLKEAEDEAAFELLKDIWMDYPLSWKVFVERGMMF